MRTGRGGQDHDGGRAGRHGGRRAGRAGAGAHRRPGPPAGRCVGVEGDRERRGPHPRRRVHRGGGPAEGRVVGGHARHQAELGRPHPHPCARRGDPRADPGQSAVPEHLGPLRAVARLHRHGAALRDPHRGQVRPDRGGHAADAQRARLPRCAPAHGRLLLLAPAALVDRALPLAAGEHGVPALLPGGRPHPRHAVPGRHLGVLHLVPVDVRRVRRARRGGHPAALGPTHHLHGRLDPRGHAGPGGRVLLRRADEAPAPPGGRSC